MEADSEGRRVNMARGGCDMVCVGCTGGVALLHNTAVGWVPRGWDPLSRQGHLSKQALFPR